jgi:hypothetical protein
MIQSPRAVEFRKGPVPAQRYIASTVTSACPAARSKTCCRCPLVDGSTKDAAARGPFQAGALAELLPSLIAEGHRPVVLLGTSSGAITAGLLAQFADQEPAAAGQSVVDTWTGFGDVFTNPLYTPKPAAAIAARFAGRGEKGLCEEES